MILVGALGTLGGYLAMRHRAPRTSAESALPPNLLPTLPASPPPTAAPRDPASSSLSAIVLHQADVPSTVVVQPIPEGTQVSSQAATLDLCNGTFPSETLRRSRLQVAGYDGSANDLLSTEGVLYANPAAAEQAFSELKSVAANCPATPVTSPVGAGTATTHFNATPDATWAQTPTVTRQAYDFVETDDTGVSLHVVTVYLRRGRALLAIYFHHPDSPQVPVAGQATIEGIAGIFAGRLAGLPASVVNG